MAAGFFKSGEAVNRTIKGVRDSERHNLDESQIPAAYGSFTTAPFVLFEVTGPKVTTDVPPFEDGLTESGLWPIRIIFANYDFESPSEKWVSIADQDGIGLAIELNDDNFKVGKRYRGQTVGERNTKPFVVSEATNKDSDGGGPGGSDCPISVRLPCTDDGTLPCYIITSLGVIYYPCNDGNGGPGGDDGTLNNGDVLVVCDGDEPITLPKTISVTATNGTRAFIPLGSVQQNSSASGGTWPININNGKVRIAGYLTFCCDAPIKGLYFVGQVYSLNNDPNEDEDEDDFWCGCARNFTACPPCNQTIVFGPQYDPLAEILRLDVGCGTVDIIIGPCTPIDNWQGPGYYCVEGCTAIDQWQGPGYYCIQGDSGG